MVISVDDLKAYLRIQHDEEEDVLESLIEQAQEAAENYCRTSFGDTAPNTVKLAVKLMCAHYYENRDNPDKQVYIAMRMAFENLLYPHRVWTDAF